MTASTGHELTPPIMKLLSFDLSRHTPAPIATPNLADLHRLWDSHEKFCLNLGDSYEATWPAMRVDVQDDRERPRGFTDFMLTVPFRIASARFVNVLREFGCECEYLPLQVGYGSERLVGRYFALNAMRVAKQVIDRERSVIGFYDEELGMAEDVEELVLKDEAMGDEPLAYLAEIGRFAVRDELAEALTRAGLVGVETIAPELFPTRMGE